MKVQNGIYSTYTNFLFLHSKYAFFKKCTSLKEWKKLCVFHPKKKKNVYSIYTFFKECTQFYPYNIQNLINEQNSIHLIYTILYINMHNISMKLLNIHNLLKNVNNFVIQFTHLFLYSKN